MHVVPYLYIDWLIFRLSHYSPIKFIILGDHLIQILNRFDYVFVFSSQWHDFLVDFKAGLVQYEWINGLLFFTYFNPTANIPLYKFYYFGLVIPITRSYQVPDKCLYIHYWMKPFRVQKLLGFSSIAQISLSPLSLSRFLEKLGAYLTSQLLRDVTNKIVVDLTRFRVINSLFSSFSWHFDLYTFHRSTTWNSLWS